MREKRITDVNGNLKAVYKVQSNGDTEVYDREGVYVGRSNQWDTVDRYGNFISKSNEPGLLLDRCKDTAGPLSAISGFIVLMLMLVLNYWRIILLLLVVISVIVILFKKIK